MSDTILDMDSLLDSNLAGVKDVPDFIQPPAGNYGLKINDCKIEKYKTKAKDGKPEAEAMRIRLLYEVEEVIDVVAGQLPPASGSLFSENFTATEDGLAFFKKQAKQIMNVTDLGDTSLREIIGALKDVSFKAAVSTRKSGEYENVNVRPVHDTAPV